MKMWPVSVEWQAIQTKNVLQNYVNAYCISSLLPLLHDPIPSLTVNKDYIHYPGTHHITSLQIELHISKAKLQQITAAYVLNHVFLCCKAITILDDFHPFSLPPNAFISFALMQLPDSLFFNKSGKII